MAERIQAVGPAGVRVEATPEELAAMGPDYRALSPEELERERLEAEYGGAAGMVGSFAKGALRGATVTGSDMAGAAVGLGDELAALEEVNPTAHMVGEFAGGLLGLGKFGAGAKGASWLARGARGLSTPARALTTASTKAATALGGGIRGAAAGAALEGAVYGGMSVAADAALRDKELTAEAVLAAAGQGGLFGAALGGGLAGAGKLLAHGASRGTNMLTRALNKAGDPKAPGSLVKAWSLLSGRAADDLGRVMGDKAFRHAAVNSAAHVDKAVDGFVDALERAHKFKQGMVDEFTGLAKYETMAANIAHENAALSVPAAQQMVTDMSDHVAKLIKSEVHSSKKLAGLQKQLKAVESRIAKAVANGGDDVAAQAYMAADDAKRELGRVLYSKTYRKRGVGPAERATYEALDDFYHKRARDLLENGALWGDEAAGTQRALNKAFTETIETAELIGYDRLFTHATAIDKGRPIYGFSRDKAARAVRQLISEGNGERLGQLMSHLDRMNGAADGVLGARGINSRLVELAQGSRGAGAEAAKRAKAARFAAEAGETMGRLRQSSAQGGLVSTGFGYILGAGGDPLTAAALGGAVNALRNPAGVIERMVALESIAGGVTKTMAKRARGLTKGTRGSLVTRGTVKAAIGAHHAGRAVGGARSREDRYEQSAKNIRGILADREGSATRMRNALAAVQTVAPEVVDMAVAKQLSRAEYLAQHLPTAAMPRTPFELPPVPSKVEVDEYMRRLEIVEDPTKALDLIEAGELTHEHVEALEATAPAMLAQMRNDVFTGLLDAQERGEAPPFGRRLQLGLLLGIPADPMMDPELIADFQAMYTNETTPEAAADAPSPGAAPAVAAKYATDSNKLSRENY